MDGRPDVSVVISTYNRSAELDVALDAVLRQRGGVRYEVIVVDNNSTDGTADVVRARIGAGEPRLRYVFEPRQGLPFGRNAGIGASSAPIIAFTDDDVYVAPGWVEAIHRAFETHPEVDAIGGRILPRWPGAIPPWLSAGPFAPLALCDRGERPMAVSAENAAPCLIGANFAFRRRVFERIGLFDTSYLRNEDRELQLRLWAAGGRGLYWPEMVVHVDVPAERVTKGYYRFWYGATGRFHSRMRLLDRLDARGRLVDPDSHRTVLGVPAFLVRQLLGSIVLAAAGYLGGRTAQAFGHEIRARYLATYVKERLAERGALHLPPPPPLSERPSPPPALTLPRSGVGS